MPSITDKSPVVQSPLDSGRRPSQVKTGACKNRIQELFSSCTSLVHLFGDGDCTAERFDSLISDRNGYATNPCVIPSFL